MVDQFAIDISLNGSIDVAQIRDDRFDVQALHAFVGYHSHSAADDRTAIGDDLGHAGMFSVRFSMRSVPCAVMLFMVGFAVEMIVPQFFPHLATDGLSFLVQIDGIDIQTAAFRQSTI